MQMVRSSKKRKLPADRSGIYAECQVNSGRAPFWNRFAIVSRPCEPILLKSSARIPVRKAGKWISLESATIWRKKRCIVGISTMDGTHKNRIIIRLILHLNKLLCEKGESYNKLHTSYMRIDKSEKNGNNSNSVKMSCKCDAFSYSETSGRKLHHFGGSALESCNFAGKRLLGTCANYVSCVAQTRVSSDFLLITSVTLSANLGAN